MFTIYISIRAFHIATSPPPPGVLASEHTRSRAGKIYDCGRRDVSTIQSSSLPSPSLPTTSAPYHSSNISARSSSTSEKPTARIDDLSSPVVRLAATKLLDVGLNKERWHGIARDWYVRGLIDTPGTSKLHHHIGLLSREKDRGELRAVYHFVER